MSRALYDRPQTTVPEVKTDPPRPRCASRRVLLADDDTLNRELSRRLLESHGWSVVAVADGEAALAAMASERFDLVLLDVEMPGLDGPRVARRIRDRESAGSVARATVLALTAHRREEERRRCLDAGMDGCLTKPLAPAALERLLAGDDAPAPEAAATSGAGVDWRQALAAVNGDRELLTRLAASARREVGRRLTALTEALAAARAVDARRAAHSLRGTLRIFGAGEARRLAAELETLAASGRLDRASELLDRSRRRLDSVSTELAAGPPAAGEPEEG